MRKRLISVLLLLSLLLCGCASDAACMASAGEDGESFSFQELEYRRPDITEMEALVEELGESLSSFCRLASIKQLLDKCYEQFYHFDTMYTLAEIRSCQDMSDEFYAQELSWCSENYYRMQELMDEIYSLCAKSRYASRLEEQYFWEGFVSDYAGEREEADYSAAYELMRQESRLLSQYRALIANPWVRIGEEDISLEEHILSADEEQYYQAMDAYYEQYCPQIAGIFIQLVAVRQELAASLGYTSYEQMQYEYTFQRDYTSEQAKRYLEDIKTWLSPYYVEVMSRKPYDSIDWSYLPSEELHAVLANCAGNMGGDIGESYEYMDSYGLYDIDLRPYKAASSFQTYLSEYEAPFLFLDPYGDLSDVLSYAHEFGHYVDAYVNYNAYETTDVAESFSQAMEYLLLCYPSAEHEELFDQLKTLKALDTLELYVQQAAFASFESRVYNMDSAQLSAQTIEELFMETGLEYGCCESWDKAYGKTWIDVEHFFEQPFYIISYPVSNNVAMQIYELELENSGAGLEKYEEMLPREYEGFMETVSAAGLESPFVPGRIERVLNLVKAEPG